MKEYKKQMPILPIKFSIIIYNDPGEVIKRFPGYKFDKDLGGWNGFMLDINGVIYICFQNNGKLNHGHVAHECKHLINMAFSICGVKLDPDNDEMECYFLTYVVNEVYKHLKL